MTEQEIREIFNDSLKNTDSESCKNRFNQLSHESPSQVHAANLGFVLASLSIDRQEKILAEQKTVLDRMDTQSKAMTTHSTRMLWLTYAILAAMGFQILLYLKELKWI